MNPVWTLILIACCAMITPGFAHDGGHGPKLTDMGKQGGIVAPVIEAKDAEKGHHAQAVYKSEIVRTDDGTVYVFLYDMKMNALDAEKFSATFNPSAEGTVEFKKSKKWVKQTFSLKTEDGGYVGKAPKAKVKPYNIDVVFKDTQGRELFTAFDNLD